MWICFFLAFGAIILHHSEHARAHLATSGVAKWLQQ